MTQPEAARRYAMIFLVSLAILLAGIATSAGLLPDEVFYIGAAHNLISGADSTNPEHPPLAKYWIALSIKTFGDAPMGWRFPSALAGALLALCAFGLTERLTGSLHTAYIAWGLLVVNGFWFVMSRTACLSISELAFEMAAVWTFIIAVEQKNRWSWFAAAGVLFGLSVGTRWLGVVGLIVCSAYALVVFRSVKRSALMIGSAIAVYFATWIPLLIREHRRLSYLVAGNTFILHFHRHATTDLRAGEPWWTWPTTLSIPEAPMEMLANPVIAILGLAALALLLWHHKPLLPVLFLGHMAQWAVTSSHWQHYSYYLEPFTWLTLALAVALKDMTIRRMRADVLVLASAASLIVLPLYWAA